MATTSPPRRKANPPAAPAGKPRARQTPAAAGTSAVLKAAGKAVKATPMPAPPAPRVPTPPPAGKAVPGRPARRPAAKTTSKTAAEPTTPARKAAPQKAAPAPQTAAPAKAPAAKTAAKEAPAKKTLAKKAAAKKALATQTVAAKPVAQKTGTKSLAAKRPAARPAAAPNAAAKKTRAKPAVAAAARGVAPVPVGASLPVVAAVPVAVPAGDIPLPALPVAAPVAAPVAGPAAAPLPAASATPAPVASPTGPAHSEINLTDGLRRWLVWQPGQACPPALQAAAAQRLDDQQHFAPEDDTALPTLLRLAADAGHALRVDDAVWPHLAAHRDARSRLAVLAAAYPAGPASPGLRGLLRSPLPAYQAEGALFAVVAGRALLADERGLGKGVMALAAATLWQRHFGVRRILLLCAAGQRVAWQRAWARFADPAGPLAAAQVMDGGLHQRHALWSSAAGVRILSPDALASDRAHATHWAPDLVIVDEPQQLHLSESDWAGLQSPHALVLCGATLAEQPGLMQSILAWLDADRLGPLAALHELQAASAMGLALTEPDIERLTASLSRTMLQRDRADLADQLPPVVHSERLLALAPGQREAHDRQLGVLQGVLAAWRHSGYLSDADQWRLAQALRAAQQACHRADPADAGSALAEPTVQALQAQLADWAATGPLQVAVLCASAADRAQLAQRLLPAGAGKAGDTGDESGESAAAGDGPHGLHLLLPDDALPAGLDAVLQAGVPWRTRRSPAGPRGQAAPGQQWVYLVAQDSLEGGLFNTLAGRHEVPRGLGGSGDAAGRQFLQGDRLADWLRAVAAAVQAALQGGG